MSEAVRHLEQEYDTEVRFRAVLVSSERITPEASGEEVRELVLDVERPDFPYRAGQSIGVLAPGAAEFGKGHHYRLYSVADLPERGESGRPRIKIAVRRCSYVDDYSGERYPGVASNYLCDRRPGDERAAVRILLHGKSLPALRAHPAGVRGSEVGLFRTMTALGPHNAAQPRPAPRPRPPNGWEGCRPSISAKPAIRRSGSVLS